MKKLFLILSTLTFIGTLKAQLPTSPLCLIESPGIEYCPVDATTGVTAGRYAKWNSAGTALVVGATTDSAGQVIGIASATQVGGFEIFYTSGSASANFDGATTAADYCGVSTSTGGLFTDQGTSGNAQSWCRVNGSNSVSPYATPLWIYGHVPEAIPTKTFTSGPVTDPGGANYYLINNASGALTFDLPAGVPGMQRCYWNATGKSGVITIAVTTSNAIDYHGTNGTTTTGTLVSGGAAGDSVCLTSDATNHWKAFPVYGAFTNN